MYYKFLKAGGKGPYSNFVWPLPTKNPDGSWTPGDWVEVQGDLTACRNGLHLCRKKDVIAGCWWQELLYAAEIGSEEMIESESKVVVRKARLLRQLEWWDIENPVWPLDYTLIASATTATATTISTATYSTCAYV